MCRSSGSRSPLAYRCLSGCIYRALGLQIKMDLTQTFCVGFMSDTAEGGLSRRPQRPHQVSGSCFLEPLALALAC